MKAFKIFGVMVLGVLLLYSLVRLQTLVTRFGNKSAQVDFSVIYTAGEALERHLPLFRNTINENPPLWDGTAKYEHSRFIYTPLTALPFQLLSNVLPYYQAKFFWMYFILLCLVASTLITAYALKLSLSPWHYLALGVFGAWFFPLVTALERGQIDSLILLVSVIAISYVAREKPRPIVSGFFWAFATLVKVHVGLVAFFFVIRKQWKLLWGYILGGITIAVLTTLFMGPGILYQYVTVELPRIIKHGGDGDATETPLPASYFENYYKQYAPGKTSGLYKDGHFYEGVPLSFAWNASLSRFLVMRAQEISPHFPLTPSVISLVFIAALLPYIFFVFRKKEKRGIVLPPESEYLYWYGVLMIIMLLGPLTWTMNAVWFIPLAVLPLVRHPWSKNKMSTLPWSLLVIALIAAAVPDCMYLGWRDFASPSLFCKVLDSSKYIFAEMLIIAALWLHINKTKNVSYIDRA